MGGYVPGAYQEQQWEVITAPAEGQLPNQSSFLPQEFERVGQLSVVDEPMFERFDGRTEGSAQEPGPESLSGDEDQSASQTTSRSAEESLETEELRFGENEQYQLEPSEDPQVEPSVDMVAVAEEAYARGIADARAEIAESERRREERFIQVIEDLQAQAQEMARNHENRAVELAFQVAKKLVGDIAEHQREYVIRVINEGIAAAEGSQMVRISVSPQDYEFLSLEGMRDRIKTQTEHTPEFRRDETIKAGCVITTEAGEIDFDLDRAWARLHDKVMRGSE